MCFVVEESVDESSCETDSELSTKSSDLEQLDHQTWDTYQVTRPTWSILVLTTLP